MQAGRQAGMGAWGHGGMGHGMLEDTTVCLPFENLPLWWGVEWCGVAWRGVAWCDVLSRPACRLNPS
jgi:hypothetical protein